MRILAIVGVLGILTVGASGCATFEPGAAHKSGGGLTQVSGLQVDKHFWESAVHWITPVAAFQLNCPPEQVQLTLLSVTWPDNPVQVGASGCGRRQVYIPTPHGMYWVSMPAAGSDGQ